ncbi:MAG: SHOCT domain-containing protein [Gaiellales bacterium]
MEWDHMNGWGWAMMMFWSLIWIGVLVVVAWVAVQWARGSQDGRRAQPPAAGERKSARELLDERLARGEIDVDEYQRRRSAMELHSPAGP